MNECYRFVKISVRWVKQFDTVGIWRLVKLGWFLERKMPLKVVLIGRSSHWRMYLDTRLSRFSTTHVFERSATERFQEIFERKKLL